MRADDRTHCSVKGRCYQDLVEIFQFLRSSKRMSTDSASYVNKSCSLYLRMELGTLETMNVQMNLLPLPTPLLILKN